MHVGVTNDKGAAYSVRVTDHEISHKQKNEYHNTGRYPWYLKVNGSSEK